MEVDTSGMMDIEDLPQSNLDYNDELFQLAQEAKDFISSQKWLKKIEFSKFDRGWGYMVGIFFFGIEPVNTSIPKTHWVIVGDLPPAYIDANDNPNGACALESYIYEMQRWVDNVLQGKSTADLISVNAPPTSEFALMLQSRLNILKEEVLDKLRDEINEGFRKLTDS